MNRCPWLAEVPWELVVWQNEQLCKAKNAHHGPTSDGHPDCKILWETNYLREMTIDEMVDLCRRCHLHGAVHQHNGDTFSAIARAIIETMPFPDQVAKLARSLAGHIVAGVAGEEEITAFRKLCDSLG